MYWTIWLDYGPNFGLDFRLDSGICIQTISHFQAFPPSSIWLLPAFVKGYTAFFRPRQCIIEAEYGLANHTSLTCDTVAKVAASEHTCSDNMPCVHTYFVKEAAGILRIDCKQAEEWKTTIDLPHMNMIIFLPQHALKLPHCSSTTVVFPWVGTKPGLWTMDRIMDSILDSVGQ